MLNLLLISFFLDKLPINAKMLDSVFPGKLSSNCRKNHLCGQKKPESTSSAIFGVETAAKCCELKRCVDRQFATEPTRQIWTFCLNFVAKLFSPKLNFLPSTKKTTEDSFEFFSINKFVFDLCCLCLFC